VVRASAQKKEEKERIRQELLRATLRLAARHGFASLGLREVSREAGIAPTSFYRHFGDMEELGLALIGEQVQPVFTELAACAKRANETSDDVAQSLVDGLEPALSGDPELLRFVLAERHGASRSFRQALRKMLTTLASALLPGKPVVPPLPAAELAVTVLLDGCNRLLDAEESARAELRAELLNVLRWLLRTKPMENGVS